MSKYVEPKKKPTLSFKKANLNVPIHYGTGKFARMSPCGATGENDVTTDDWDYVTCGDCFRAAKE